MLGRRLIGLAFSGLLAVNALGADVVVRISPPRAVVERRGPAPGRAYVWIPGYQNWNGRGYMWVPGRWELPPRPHARWVPYRWVRHDRGWVLVQGRWR